MTGGRTGDLVHYVHHPRSSEPEQRGDRGWICPRCGKSLAPWVRECRCMWFYTAWLPQGGYFTSPYEHETTTIFMPDNGTWWPPSGTP